MSWRPLEQLLLTPPADRPVAIADETAAALDHAELCRRAGAFAGWLGDRRRVALHLGDATELAVALLGGWLAGARLILPGDDREQTRALLAPRIDCWLDQLPPSALTGAALPARVLDLDHTGLTLCTSGSTGQPKFIDKQLRQLANEVTALEECWGAALGDATIVGSVSAQHIYGLLFRVLWPLCAGRPFARLPQLFPEELQRVSLAQPAVAWVASPALLKRMGDNLDWPALRRVRAVFSSGGELPAEAGAQLQQRLGQRPIEIYGSSETGGIAWRQGGARWQPFAGVTLQCGADGALAVRSPYLPAGATEQTADAIELTDDGGFLLRGRLDRIVKLEEKRIALPRLEQALAGHDWVDDVRLGVVRGPLGDSQAHPGAQQPGRAYLGAVVALSPTGLHALRNQGRRALTETLRAHLAQHCERLALPRRWRLVHQLPFNAQGKLPQAAIDTLLAAPRPTRPALLSREGADHDWTLALRVPLDLAHFSGHFPQTPVVPGVVQIDWVQRLARELMALPGRFAGMEVLKFQRLVRPGDELQVTLRFDAARGKLHFTCRDGDAPCSSGRILLEPVDG